MLGLLALVALASGGRRAFTEGAAHRREPPAAFWDFLFTGLVLLFVAGGIFLVVSVALGRSRLATPRSPGRQLMGLVFMVGVVFGLVLVIRTLQHHGVQIHKPQQPPAAQQLDPRTQKPGDRTRYEPQFRWDVVAALGALAAAGVATAVVRRRRRRARAADGGRLEAELADVVDDTLDDLRAEPDPRRAVVAAYARMERALGAYGLPRRRAEAPLEYLDRASRELHATHPPARRLLFELTHLFERAKFSAHRVDAEMKEDAIETLTTLRAELAGGSA
jgi:hypothetical protein